MEGGIEKEMQITFISICLANKWEEQLPGAWGSEGALNLLSI